MFFSRTFVLKKCVLLPPSPFFFKKKEIQNSKKNKQLNPPKHPFFLIMQDSTPAPSSDPRPISSEFFSGERSSDASCPHVTVDLKTPRRVVVIMALKGDSVDDKKPYPVLIIPALFGGEHEFGLLYKFRHSESITFFCDLTIALDLGKIDPADIHEVGDENRHLHGLPTNGDPASGRMPSSFTACNSTSQRCSRNFPLSTFRTMIRHRKHRPKRPQQKVARCRILKLQRRIQRLVVW
jgi:hypothetical protein